MRTPAPDPLPRVATGIMLRRLTIADLAAFQAYRGDPELGRYQGWSPMSDEEASAFLSEMSTAPLFRPGSWTQIGIAEAVSQDLSGDIGLFLAADGRHAEIGFTLGRHAQGRGVATTAVREAIKLIFDCSCAERVLGITDARNSASVRLMARVGMERVESRSTVFRGEPCEEWVYAVARTTLGMPPAP
jgi:[ribosomal protein S5]-alanine N-acetyltransferase